MSCRRVGTGQGRSRRNRPSVLSYCRTAVPPTHQVIRYLTEELEEEGERARLLVQGLERERAEYKAFMRMNGEVGGPACCVVKCALCCLDAWMPDRPACHAYVCECGSSIATSGSLIGQAPLPTTDHHATPSDPHLQPIRSLAAPTPTCAGPAVPVVP